MNYFIPDPDRASKNIETFLSENPERAGELKANIEKVSMLFSHSQFLANYCTKNPDALFSALKNLNTAFEVEDLGRELNELFKSCNALKEGMAAARVFRKDKFLIITLKDILKLADQQEIMLDMSALADAILSESLCFIEPFLKERYGAPENNSMVVIGLGKLGAQELNYSSDVDLIFIYREEGETSGVSAVHGVTMNRLSSSEYYIKLVEEYARFLSSNTEDGFAYRVDMRLRPQGQRGSLALALRSYEEYYESWGQLWEKAVLLRARPVAGDLGLGEAFLETVKPFVYRKYIDFHAIEELRRMKAQVEQIKPGTSSSDIKRGYGGIREIEFFIQIFQMIYGGKEPLLRERSTLKALHRLLQKGFIGHEDFRRLSDNYIFLRTLEHRIQQLNDVQTHTLPSGAEELEVLAKKMGFPDSESFMSVLDSRRLRVRAIYDSLLEVGEKQAAGDEGPVSRSISYVLYPEGWDMGPSVEHLLAEELSATGVKDAHKAIHCLMKIRNNIHSFQTIKGRRLLEDLVPEFIAGILRGGNPDLALLQMIDFSGILTAKESYLEVLSQRREIISVLNFVFSNSEYLSKILMSNPEYIESLVEGGGVKKTLGALREELKVLIDKHGENTAVRLFKRLEEIRLGVMFLNRKIALRELMRSLSKTAEAVLGGLLGSAEKTSALSVISFGKLGGREISFNSDLDVTFVTLGAPSGEDIRAAERLLKGLMSYTKYGAAYKIDTRLRPDGSKGPLVSSIEGIADYYSGQAHGWELQALLKARTVPGEKDCYTGRLFMDMRRDILVRRGNEVTISELRDMRERIQKELSKDSRRAPVTRNQPPSFDLKLGSGGIEELEFSLQYLQLKHCRENPGLLVQNTSDAIRLLDKKGILKGKEAAVLSETYLFYRTVETILRLRNEAVLKTGGSVAQSLADFMGTGTDGLFNRLNEKRQWIKNFWDGLE